MMYEFENTLYISYVTSIAKYTSIWNNDGYYYDNKATTGKFLYKNTYTRSKKIQFKCLLDNDLLKFLLKI